MLLLLFSSNVTPRIFFATGPSPHRHAMLRPFPPLYWIFVANIGYRVQHPGGAGFEGMNGQEDRSGRAFPLPRLHRLLEPDGRGPPTGEARASARAPHRLRRDPPPRD